MKNAYPNSYLPSPKPGLKVALVCDWLTGVGGAERVVLELHKMFPDAPIYTSQYDQSKLDWFKNADVRTGWLQKMPKSLKKFLPVLRARYFSRLDLSEYDLVVSNTGAEAKAVRLGKKTVHVCICNAPTHYYWSRYEEYLKHPGFPTGFNWLARLGLKLLVGPLRRWDKKAAQRPTHMIAISKNIQDQIKKYYNRETEIIYPPVYTERFKQKPAGKKDRSGFLIVGRQTPYKRFDLAVAACTKLNLPLTVVGTGPEHEKLVKAAGPTVTFDTNASDQDVVNYLFQAEGFIFPGLDDFGVAPVEAMAAGCPVVAYKAGGALEYVIPGKTGEFFEEQRAESLAATLQHFDPTKYSEKDLRANAERFSVTKFRQKVSDFLEKLSSLDNRVDN